MRKNSLRYGMAGVTPFTNVDFTLPGTDYKGYASVGSIEALEEYARLDLEKRELDIIELNQEAVEQGTRKLISDPFYEEVNRLVAHMSSQNPEGPIYSDNLTPPSERKEGYKDDATFLDAWRQANVQGHSVNLSKKLEELYTTEAKWIPEIKQALEYLKNKKGIIALSKVPGKEQVVDSLLARNNEIERNLKVAARTNPYLTDILYETMPGKVLNQEEFGVLDLLNSFTYDFLADDYIFSDINPGNNLKHMLQSGGLKGLFGRTHTLNDAQLNRMWNLRNTYDEKDVDKQIKSLSEMEESALLQFDEKNEDILDKLNTIAKGNWLFDPTKINPDFTKNFLENEIKLSNPKSWLYALPHLGSSYSEVATTIALMGAAALLNNVAKGALATTTGGTLPLLYAATETAAMLALNQYQRESETSSEAFDNYTQRVLEASEKGDIDMELVYEDVDPILRKYGYDVENMDDYVKFLALLATRALSTNETFNKIADDSRKGIDYLKETNRALSAGDYLEAMMFSYGGAYLSKMYGASSLKRSLGSKADDKIVQGLVDKGGIETDPFKLSNLPLFEQGNKLLNRTLTRVSNKAAKAIKNPITRIAIKDGLNTLKNIGKRSGVSYFVEQTEEGQQYLTGKEFREGKYDDFLNYSFLDGLVNVAKLGVEANAAYYGIHPDNNLNTDEELMKNMSIGGFTGLFMTGAYSAPSAYHGVRQTVTDVKLRALAADDYAKAEKDFKIEQFMKAGIGVGDLRRVINTLEQLKDNKPDGVTDEMIDSDISLAMDVQSYANSKVVKEIVPLISDYDKEGKLGEDNDKTKMDIVKNAVHVHGRYREQANAMGESVQKLTDLLEKMTTPSTEDDTSFSETFIKSNYERYVAEQKRLIKLAEKEAAKKELAEKETDTSKVEDNKKEKKQEGNKEDKKEGKENDKSEAKEESEESTIVDYDTYKKSLLNQLASYHQYNAAVKLLKDLAARGESLEKLSKDFPHLSVNTESLKSIKKFIDEKVEALEENTRHIRKVLNTDELQALSLPGQEDIELSVAEALMNTAASRELRKHRDAYILGLYNSLDKKDVNARKKAFNIIKEDVLKRRKLEKIALLEKEELFGITREPSQQEIHLKNEELKKQKEEEQKLLKKEEVKPVASTTDEQKQNEGELIDKKEETKSETKEEQQEPKLESKEESKKESSKREDEVPPIPIIDTIEEKDEPTTVVDKAVAEDLPTVIDNVEELDDVSKALQSLDEIVAPKPKIELEFGDSSEIVEDEDGALESQINALNSSIADSNALIEVATNSAVEVSNSESEAAIQQTFDDVTSGKYKVEQEELQLNSAEEADKPRKDSVEEVSKDKELLLELESAKKEEEKKELEEAPPVETSIKKPTVTTKEDSKTPADKIQGAPKHVFIDPSTDNVMWDPSGQGDMDNSMAISSELLAILNDFDYSLDSPIVGPGDFMNSAGNVEKQEGLDNKDKQKRNRIKNTFFYQPASEEAMPITVAGKPIKFTTKDGKEPVRGTGSLLAKKLTIPGWLSTADDIYYIVTSSTHNTSSPYDDLAVHMIIEKDGVVYNTSLRQINDKLREDLKYLGLNAKEVLTEINELRALRKKIIDSYSTLYFSTGNLPTTALKHVKPGNLRISNGTIDNVKVGVGESTKPVYRTLNSIPTFGIATDPIELSEQIATGEVELGYGVGAFTQGEPYSISKLDESGDTSVQGTGYAGKIYYIPKTSQTPSQRVTLPIMLAEELHTLDTDNADEVKLAYDAKGNRIKDENGKPVPVSTAELIFNLITGEVFGKDIDEALLSILAHVNSRTVTIGLTDLEKHNLQFLVRKQLYMYTDKKGNNILITAGRKLENDPSKGYNTRFTNMSTLTDSLKRAIVLDISRNIHWNTDKRVMSLAIPQPIIDAVVSTARLHPENDENTQYPFGSKLITFSLKDVGYTIKDGKVTKVSDKTPIVASWMINHGKLKTDVSENVFRAPFVYADNVTVLETKVIYPKPIAKPIAKKEVTSTGEKIETEPAKKGATEAIPATPENLTKYGLSIPEGMGLLGGRVWGIYTDKKTGNLTVGQVPKRFVKGVYSVVQGSGNVEYDKAKQWLMDTLGLDVTQVRVVNGAMRMMSDADVFGVMQVALDRVKLELLPSITLSNKAGKGIEFHEAWHYVSLLLLNDVERLALYTEYVDNNPKAASYTNEEIEEALAEEFRSWMLKETSPGITAKIRSFFRHMKEFIMKVSGKGSKYYAFNAIRSGHFKRYQPSQEALKQFSDAYQDGVFYYIPGVTKEELSRLPSITDADVFYNIVDSLTSSALALLKIKSSEDILKARTDVIFDYIQEELDNDWLQENAIELAKEVIANKDVFKKYIYDKLDELKLKEIERIETEEENRLKSETGETNDNNWDKSQGDTSKKANVSFNAKLFFYSIPKTKYVYVTNEDGSVVKQKVEVLDPIFGLPVTEQFDIVWNMIMDNMWDCETANDPDDQSSLVNTAYRLASTEPFFDSLYKILTSTEDPISENTMTLLINTIKSSKNSMTTIFIEPKPVDKKLAYDASDALIADAYLELKSQDKFTWDAKDSDALRKIKRYPRQWSNSFFTSDNVQVMEDGSRRVSTGGYKYVLVRRIKINKLMTLAKNGKIKDAELAIKLQEAQDTFLDICNTLGIPFDVKALNYMFDQLPEQKGPTINSDLNKFYHFWTSRGQSFNNGTLSDIFTMYNNKSSSITNRSGKVTRSLDRIFTTADTRAQINLMAVAYGKTHPTPEEFSVTGADKSLIYPISENNYMSDQIRWLNNNHNNKRDAIKKTPYSASSLIANSDAKFKLHTLIAINDSNSGTSRDYFGISPLEDYIAKLTITLKIPADFKNLPEGTKIYGDLVLPTMSDKKTWYSISGLKINKHILSSVRNVFTGDLTNEETSVLQESGRRFGDDALAIMVNYFKDELNSVINYYTNKAYIESHPEEAVTNYHGKIVDGKMQPNGNGGRFRYFNQLNLSGETAFLNRDLARYEKYGTNEEILAYLNNLKELAEGAPGMMLDSMNTLLLENVAEEIEKISASDIGILSKDLDGNYKNKLIPDNIYDYYDLLLSKTKYATETLRQQDIIYSIIGNHVLMNIISILELEKCFVGDPAYYKWENTTINEEDGISYEVPSVRDIDKTKRLSSVLSTGTNLRTYWGVNDKRNDTSFTVMNLTDNYVYSSYYDKLKDIFRTSLIRDMLSNNNPKWSDDKLMEETSTPEKIEEAYKSLDEEQRDFVDKQSVNSANPYGFEEKNGKRKGNINQADAAVYIRPAMYKRIMESLGEWNDDIEEAFNILEGDDESWINDERYEKALALIIKPLKMTYFGDHFNDMLGLNVPVYDKMAIFPMFKMLAKADNRLLYDRMNNEELGTIDMIAFESAVKVGGRKQFQTYTDAENTQFNTEELSKPSYSKFGKVGNLPTYKQDLRQLRLQLNTDPHYSIDRSFGTQAAKICLGNIVDDRTYGSNKGREIKGSEIKDVAMNVINSLADKGRSNVMRRFFEKGAINNKALSEYLISQAKSSGLSRELIEGLLLDENGEFRTPIAAMSIRNWVESRVIALVNKECIDINTPGGSAIQMASFGFKATGVRKQEAIGKAFNDGNALSFLNEDGSMDVMLSANFFRHVVPLEYLKNFGMMRKWLKDNNIIGENAKPFGIGYRIPTQGLSSTFAFKVMDILPSSVGDTIVVPDEFTGMTGSDFDVDKIYLATRSYDKEGNLYKFDESLPYRQQTTGALQNELLDMYTAVVSDEKNMAETRASIDTLTSIMKKDIVKLVKKKSKEEALPFYEMMPSFQLGRKKEFTGGKMGIAPFALNSTNHCLTQVTHLTINYSKGNPYKLGALDEIKGKDNFRILDWLSAMINAHVDVAKDPYVIDLNVNKVTYNMTALLLRGGMGDSTFYYLALPILKTFADMKLSSEGVYGALKYYDNQIIGALYDQYEHLLRKAIIGLDKDSELYKEYSSKFNGWVENRTKSDNPKIQAKRAKPIDEVLEPIEMNKDDVFNKDMLIHSLKNVGSVLHLYQQLMSLKAYSELQEDANVLGELVLVSQIDTKKYGNNIISQLDFTNKYNVFKHLNYKKFRLTDRETEKEQDALDWYFNGTFLSKKLKLGTVLPKRILKGQTFVATKLFGDIFTSTMAMFGEPVSWNSPGGERVQGYKGFYGSDKVREIGKILDTVIRARITRGTPSLKISDEKLVSMLYGKNSMSRRLSGIKQYIIANRNKFPTLVNQDGTIRNELLNYLQEFSGDGVKLIMDRIVLFNSSMNNSKTTEDRLVSAFSELLESDDEAVRDFAEDLAKYAYITNYDNSGVNSFFHLVPVWWKLSRGYVGNIKQALYDFNYDPLNGAKTISEDYDIPSISYYPSIYTTLARNMWRDPEVVKPYVPYKLSAFGKHDISINTVMLLQGKFRYPATLTLLTGRTDAKYITMNESTDSSRVLLYRKVATAGFVDTETEAMLVKYVYQLVPKLGVKDGDLFYELLKESLEQSAFISNYFNLDLTPNFDLIQTKVMSKMKSPDKGMFEPFFEPIVLEMIKASGKIELHSDYFGQENADVDNTSSNTIDDSVMDTQVDYSSDLDAQEIEADAAFFEGMNEFTFDAAELEAATLLYGEEIENTYSAGEEFAQNSEQLTVSAEQQQNTTAVDMLTDNTTEFSEDAYKHCKS